MGTLFSLWYFDQTFNIFGQIGIIMLIGLVTKNGILIVEFANQRRDAGMSILEAVMNASVSRLRPILMTSISTIFGLLPIALAFGAGSESRVSMGIAVIGGMLFGTLVSLFVIPAMYIIITGKERVVIKEEDYL
jgi:multidrug efflux pump